MTLYDLMKSTSRMRNVSATPNVELRGLKLRYVDYSKSLLVEALAYGTSVYQLSIRFLDIELSDTGIIVPTETKKIKVKIELPSYRKTHVKVSCSCPDYLYTFGLWNDLKGAHDRSKRKKFPPPGKGLRPPRNPKGFPGLCKHLVNLTETLMNSNILRP